MNLTGVNAQPFIREVAGVASGSGGVAGGAAPADVTPSPAGSGGAVVATISKPAEMFSKLRRLKDKDPDAFTEVVSTLTEKLKTAAAQHEADAAGPLLSDLASKFEEVANGGDLNALQSAPPAGLSPWQQATETLGQRPGVDQLLAGFNAALDQQLV